MGIKEIEINIKTASINLKELSKIISFFIGRKVIIDSFYKDKICFISNVLTVKEILEKNIKFVKENYEFFFVLYFNYIGYYQLSYYILKNRKKFLDEKSDCYKYLKADTLHLKCEYDSAIGILSTMHCSDNFSKEINLLLAHCYKHMGDFDNAIEKLNDQNLFSNDDDNNKKIVSVYYLKYLQSKLTFNENSENYFYKAINAYSKINNPNNKNRMYFAVFQAKMGNLNYAEKIIDECIYEFIEKDDHYIYNAYFIKAEILRLKFKYQEAYNYYVLSSGINNNHRDFNLYIENYFFTSFLERCGFVNNNASEKLYLLIINSKISLSQMKFDELLFNTINTHDLKKLRLMLIDIPFIIL